MVDRVGVNVTNTVDLEGVLLSSSEIRVSDKGSTESQYGSQARGDGHHGDLQISPWGRWSPQDILPGDV